MPFRIVFDYRFDTSGFFNDPARRAALDAAGAAWESVIGDDFDAVPAGVEFTVLNPTTRSGYETVTLAQPIDDIVIFVGAKSLPGSTLGIAGPAGYSADGDVFTARISSNFRGQGPVTDFEPWAGSMTFDSGATWNFDLGGPAAGKSDFMSVAVHEIGHVLGIGTSGAFDALVSANAFTGANARALNGGAPVPLHSDDSHVEDGFAGDSVALDPSLSVGTRKLVSEFDKAILADIGYQVTGYTAQGSQPEIATNGGETIYGTIVGDVIDGLGGADQIQGDGGDDTLFGGGGNDTLFGQAGGDTLDGGSGDDQIQGGSGDDVLRGGAGDDDLWGQGGTDTFVLGPGDQQNAVYDFNLATEVIRLVDSGFASVAAALAAITKPYSNVSRLTISDGSYLDVFHGSQSGSPLSASNIELVGGGGNSPPGGTVGIDGSPVEGATLAANTTGLSDADGLGAFSYAWLRDGAVIAGATSDTYDLTQADVGAAIALRVQYTDGGGTPESVTSAATAAVLNLNDAPTGTVVLSGTARQGETLSANAAGLGDEDGLGAFSYAWLRDGVAIPGADADRYQTGQDDVGARISVRVGYTDGHGTHEAVTSVASAVIQNVNDAPSGGVVITGTALEGETLSADTTGLADPDGLGAFAFTWLRDGGDTGAGGSTYRLEQADVGARISVRVGYTDGHGTHEAVTSGPTAPVQNVNDAPTGSVGISGTAIQGAELSALTGAIADEDGLGAFSYTWLRDDAVISGAGGSTYRLEQADVGARISVRVGYTDGEGTPESVASSQTAPVLNLNAPPAGSVTVAGTAVEDGALTADASAITDADGLGPITLAWFRDGAPTGVTGTGYALGDADVGARMTAVASYTDAQGTVETVASAATAPVQNLNDPLTGSVTIAGAAIQGAWLSAQTGALSDDDGLGAFTFTWLRNGVAIPGASADRYRPTQDDVGAEIAVRVGSLDRHGTSESATSPATAPVQNVNDAPTGTVWVHGSPVEGGTLTASASLSDPDGMGPLVFTWLRNGGETGVTGGAFALQHSDIGDRFSVRASYTDGYGRAESVESGRTAAVRNINLAPTGQVLVQGDAIEGGTLTADISTLADADGMGPVTLTWLREGAAFGATGSRLVLGDADVGARLSVVASYRDGFGTDESVQSAATGPVLNVNDPPTGSVWVAGPMRQGALLEARTADLADADGLGPLAYRWLRDGTPIAGAGDLSYRLTQADVGTDISVAVSYTDGGGMVETVVSAARGAVQNVNDDPTGTVAILGRAEQGATLAAMTGTLDDADGLGPLVYTWLRDGAAIPGADQDSHELAQADVGARISLRVGYRDGGGTDETVTSPQTGPVLNVNDPATGTVAIVGSAVQGATLAADASAIGDADGIGPFTFIWYRDGIALPGSADTRLLTQADVGARLSVGVGFTDLHGTGETVASAPTARVENRNDAPTGVVRITGQTVEGAVLSADTSDVRDADGLGPFSLDWLRDGVATGMTGPTYALTGEDIGARISARLGFTDGGGTFEAIESAATAPVANTNDPPVGGVLIAGTASQGRALFADTASLADGDGLGDFGYTWFRNGATIAGAGSARYELQQADVGARIRVEVTYLDGQGTRETVLSPETGAVTDANDPVTGSVLILGTLREGRTIQANTGGLSDPEGLGDFSFTWLRDGAPIAGAASRSYKLVQDDVGKAITVQVRFIDGLGTEEFVASQARGPVSNLNDTPTGQVVIAGAAREKEILTAEISTIGDADGLGAFSFTWLRDGTAFGAAGPTYLLGADDIGARLSVRASFTDGQGTLETLTSAATGTVLNVNDAPTGVLALGGAEKEGETLVADASGIGDFDGLGAFSYQWLRDGTPIAGAEASSYLLQLADVGSAISVELRYTDQRGTFERIASAQTSAIASLDDVMLGDDGDNVLFGGAGNDILSGGPGNDLLEGGAGADTFDINPGDETITIVDFELGTDTIDLTGFDRADAIAAFNGARPGSAILEFADGTLLTVAGDGVSPATLSRENLAFAEGNIAPTGLPVLGGALQDGAALSVDTSGIDDLEGIVPGSQRLQWLRDGQPIPGATGQTYDLVPADIGAAISVRFSFLDLFGGAESVESSRTAPIGHAPMAVRGGNSPESLEDGMGDDVIEGMGGDDRLAGMAGDDLVDGGEGLDTAVFSGGQASYTLALSPTGARVTDRREDGNGADELVDVELLEFDGGMLDLAKFGGLAGLDPADLESFIELYIAYFNRAPDALGLNFWGTAFAAGVTLEDMAALFSQGAEYRLTYPEGTTNLGFAETVYHNVLGRLPDPAGLAFWVGVLDSGYLERDAFILQVLRGAKVDPAPGQSQEFIAQQLADRDYLATKTDIGAYFAVHKGMSDLADAAAAMALYDGTQPGIAQAVNAIDMAFADALDAVDGAFLMPLVGVLDDPLGIL